MNLRPRDASDRTHAIAQGARRARCLETPDSPRCSSTTASARGRPSARIHRRRRLPAGALVRARLGRPRVAPRRSNPEASSSPEATTPPHLQTSTHPDSARAARDARSTRRCDTTSRVRTGGRWRTRSPFVAPSKSDTLPVSICSRRRSLLRYIMPSFVADSLWSGRELAHPVRRTLEPRLGAVVYDRPSRLLDELQLRGDI